MGAKLGEGSLWIKLAALCIGLTFLLFLVAMGAPNWAKSDPRFTDREETIGLWRYCTRPVGGGQVCDQFVDIITGDWLRAAQSFCILALFTLMGAVAVICIYAFVPDFSDDTRLLMIAITLTGVSALFQLIEVATMGVKYQEYFKNKDPGSWEEYGKLDWAFFVGLTALLMNVVTLVLLVFDMIIGERE